jgi:hypothetical protein
MTKEYEKNKKDVAKMLLISFVRLKLKLLRPRPSTK